MNRPPSERLALAYYEDEMAYASWIAGQGFHEDAARIREIASKHRPMPALLCGREQRREQVSA